MENLPSQIKPTFEAITAAIGTFSKEDFNTVPFDKSWTAGQVAQHVKLSIDGMPELFTAETEASNRDADEKVKMIRDVFLDFDKKYDSPESIFPEDKFYEPQGFVSFFSNYSRELAELVARLDMSEICLGFEIPGFGPMTRLEFLSFVLFHTQRHVRQMENIRKTQNEIVS